MATAGAALRLRLLYRMLRVGELLALVVLLSWSTSHVPSAAAAVVRLAGSLVFNPRFVFVLGNGIVLLLYVLSRRDPALSSSHPAVASASAGAGSAQTPAAPAAASFPASFAPAAPTPTPPPATEEQPVVTPAPLSTPTVLATPTTVFEEEKQPAVARINKARAPRRSRSEKMSQRAASPEMLRRSESDNGRRRRSSASARDLPEGRWAGMDDAVEFRRTVEAFIAEQTRFRREEETMAGYGHVVPAMGGALVLVE